MLDAAHRGYEYQDVLVAARLVDVLLETATRVAVDQKLVADDRFDDLTVWLAAGGRERIQIKHRDNEDQSLTLATFTRDDRGLQLDRLVLCAVAERDREVSDNLVFRVIMRDAPPLDEALARVLRPPAADPGPFLTGLATNRLQFDAQALWPLGAGAPAADDPFAFLRDGRLSRENLSWFCERLVIEVEAPAAGFDLTRPGPAERLVINRALNDIGAGFYPNQDRAAVDVASALIGVARAARMQTCEASRDELLRRIHIRQDFGAVARAHPVDAAVEVGRPTHVAELLADVAAAAHASVPLVLLGPPGQGKSWTCHQVVQQLVAQGWLVAEHYCFLGDVDRERDARVQAEVTFGSLLSRLATAEPSIVTGHRPRFAADEQALVAAVTAARNKWPERRVALVVDGLDHVTRVRGATTGRPAPSRALAEELAALVLPQGSTIVVLSQPGDHVSPLRAAGARIGEIPGFSPEELRLLAGRLGVVGTGEEEQGSSPVDCSDAAAVASFLDALKSRSAGNALYATYLCREVLRSPSAAIDAAAAVQAFPAFDGTLKAYYSHLMSAAAADAGSVAEVLALIDFSVTRAELREILPDRAHRLDAVIDVLAPVLSERVGQQGIRIYHESFARYLREPLEGNPTAVGAALSPVAEWLRRRGLFSDARAFRFLLPVLSRAGRAAEVLDLVGVEFAAQAVAAGFTAAPMLANLAVAVECAAALGKWDAVVRYVELARAAETYDEERLDSTVVEFSDVPIELLGADVFVDRLLYDGQPAMPARPGLLLCSRLHAMGVSSPWREYLDAYEHAQQRSEEDGPRDPDEDVEEALFRGWLATTLEAETTDADPTPRILEWLHGHKHLSAQQVVNVVWDALGPGGAKELVQRLANPPRCCLAIAERLAADPEDGSSSEARDWATRAARNGPPLWTAHRLLGLDVQPEALLAADQDPRAELLSLTEAVQKHGIQYEPEPLGRWLDRCVVAARRDAFGLAAAEALISGDGWYRCWLRFTMALARAESLPDGERPAAALDALAILTEDLRPFAGDPRPCDLHGIRYVIRNTIGRALRLVDDGGWPRAVAMLQEVSIEPASTISGELGGPLPTDHLLELVIDRTTPTRRVASDRVVAAVLNGQAGGFYADIAGFHLAAARLALAFEDHECAAARWRDACKMLVAYGFHKDMTIYELLNPLPALTAADAPGARQALSRLQPLCLRAWRHTDGKETRGASGHWWRSLAKADPGALATLVAPALLRSCNRVNGEYDEAIRELWRAQHDRADAAVSGALRLTLERGLEDEDPVALERLCTEQEGGPTPFLDGLIGLLLCRADERPMRYSVTNSAEYLQSDEGRVQRLNAAAARVGASIVLPAVDPPRELPEPVRHGRAPDPPAASETVAAGILEEFGTGVVGLGRAVRAWRHRPYDTTDPRWSVNRYANAIGYRLIELIEAGGLIEADAAIFALADSVRYSPHELLPRVAEGLDDAGMIGPAALAHSLSWTTSRGGGGWFSFGGETEIESLRRAVALDAQRALQVLGDEVARRVRSGQLYSGVTQALIIAFARVDFGDALTCSSRDMALAAWNAAADVISARLPTVAEENDAPLRYCVAPEETSDVPAIDEAFALAAVAGIAHPGRERKRRAFLATQLLVSERATVVQDAIRAALQHLSDPATLSWLLATLEGCGAAPVIRHVQDDLRELSRSPYLTVRALARGLLAPCPPLPDVPPPTGAAPELLRATAGTAALHAPPIAQGKRLVLPGGSRAGAGEHHNGEVAEGHEQAVARSIVDDVASVRIGRAEDLLPGLAEAVVAAVAEGTLKDDYQKKLRRQLDALASRTEKHWPDAFLAPYELAEEALQRVAAGGRAAKAACGEIVADPGAWETALARELLNDPRLGLGLEMVRIPRPHHPPPPAPGAELWLAASAVSRDPQSKTSLVLVAAWSDRRTLRATVGIHSGSTPPNVSRGRCQGWRTIAAAEERTIPPAGHPPSKPLTALRYFALELRAQRERIGLDRPPFGEGDARVWWETWPASRNTPLPDTTFPLIGIDWRGPAIGDGLRGLGWAHSPLAPSGELLAFLGLRSEPAGFPPLQLVDERGPALALQTWRTNYLVSDYFLARPTIVGVRLVLRSDLFDRLLAEAGARLVWRDFIQGDADLGATT